MRLFVASASWLRNRGRGTQVPSSCLGKLLDTGEGYTFVTISIQRLEAGRTSQARGSWDTVAFLSRSGMFRPASPPDACRNRESTADSGLSSPGWSRRMSTYAFMRVLESVARRYDRGMMLLSRGRIGKVYAQVADLIAAPGLRILDIGCGTGAVALACAARGAEVTGIDLNAEMLEVARSKPLPFGTSGSVEWLEMSAAEIEDRFEPASFDGVTACLVMSELSPGERSHTLAIALTRLRPGGRVVLADEVMPASAIRRFMHRVGRMPLAILTYLLTQTSTRAVSGLADHARAVGFVEVDEQRPWADFAIVHGRRPLDAA